MASNEERAKLNWRRAQLLAHGIKHTWATIGLDDHETCAVCGLARFSAGRPQEAYWPWCSNRGSDFNAPQYDTDANAVAELLRFVRKRGKMREFCGHILQIVAPALNIGACPIERIFDLLDATPAQQTAAFDAVFADELSRIE